MLYALIIVAPLYAQPHTEVGFASKAACEKVLETRKRAFDKVKLEVADCVPHSAILAAAKKIDR